MVVVEEGREVREEAEVVEVEEGMRESAVDMALLGATVLGGRCLGCSGWVEAWRRLPG